jgi:transcription elongation factor B subunit 2
MYVRIKRRQTTLFLHVEPADTVLQVKGKIQELLEAAPAAQRLFKAGAPLEDSASLAELKIETDDVLELALQSPGAPPPPRQRILICVAPCAPSAPGACVKCDSNCTSVCLTRWRLGRPRGCGLRYE